MKHQFLIILLAISGANLAHAQSEIFLCDDGKGGKTYQNTGASKGCKKVDLPGITTIPGLPRRSSTTTASRPATSPADFPRIDSTQQKSRDNDRRQILLDEMKTEEQKLADIKKEYNSGEPERRGDEKNYAKYQDRVANLKEDLGRSEKNIDALKREIGNLK
jgi:hypothetical protein